MDRLLAVMMLIVVAACATSPRESAHSDYSLSPGAVVLRVEVLQTDFTNVHPGCNDDATCMPFYYWWNYRARVKEVVQGSWPNEEVTFTRLQHGEYIRRITRDCYVVLVPASPGLSAATGATLLAERLASKYIKEDRDFIRAIRAGD